MPGVSGGEGVDFAPKMWYDMPEGMKETWLVVHPASLLMALELVEQGESATEVMMTIIDLAKASMEEDEE